MDELDCTAFCKEGGQEKGALSLPSRNPQSHGEMMADIPTRKISYQQVFMCSLNKYLFCMHCLSNKVLQSGEDSTEQDRN